jgi:hypothetical protein
MVLAANLVEYALSRDDCTPMNEARAELDSKALW